MYYYVGDSYRYTSLSVINTPPVVCVAERAWDTTFCV